MSAWRRLFRRRPYALAAAGVLAVLVSGDRALVAPPPGVGIDPFEVLDQQTKNNVLIVVDTSTAMKSPVDRDNFTIGGDDPASRLYQVKQALKTIVPLNQNRVNFGLATFNALSTDKTLNQNQDNEGDGRKDGPFVYVTADGVTATGLPAATLFHQFSYSNLDDPLTPTEDETCVGVPGFFCAISNTFDNYDGNNSGDVWRSFMNRNTAAQANLYNQGYPAGCTTAVTAPLSPINTSNAAGLRCRFYIQSRMLRDRVRYTWNRASGDVNLRLVGAPANIPGGCPAPPAGLLSSTNTTTPPCFQFQDAATGAIATYYYTSTIYENQTGATCGGAAFLVTPDSQCDNDQIPAIISKMDPELPVNGSGFGGLAGVPNPPGTATFDYGDGHLDGDQTLPEFGIRADQATPLKASLDSILATGFPAPPSGVTVRNFVILLTASDDGCADTSRDRAAVLTAASAEALFRNTDPLKNAETIVVAFGSGVGPARANVVARGGSGAVIDGASSDPATAATCPAGTTCRDAFFASSQQQLIAALNAAIEKAAASGVYSGTSSVFDGVPEYVGFVDTAPQPAFSVMDPDERYRASAFRSYRALFEAQGFKGFVRGFDEFGPMVAGTRPAPAPTYSRTWEAGQRLIDADRMSPDIDPVTGTDQTFDSLKSGSLTGPTPPGSIAGKIQRRIFTTRRNGRVLGRLDDRDGATICTGGPCRANLWPPDTAVAPPAPTVVNAGALDTRLFRKSDGTQMTITDLQTAPLRACLGTNLPTTPVDCTSTNTTTKMIAAQKEAREMILAYTAGAEARRDATGNPLRNTSGQILYRRRAWVLSESTVGTPALVTPPIALVPKPHGPEYILYRDGPRGTGSGGNDETFLRLGFGLRNPDKDGNESNGTRVRLKPEMSIVYVPANDGLHAFRAGPCPTGFGADCESGSAETGGEELWTFIPHDQLPKLKDRMKPQTRTDHTFMMSASLRFADVFLPGSYTVPGISPALTVSGRWRRLLFFGRGIGGKYYTALDITGLGALTSGALQTQLPVVLWNRGNPDTNDGLLATTQNGTNADYTAYLDMGMTWSTPALGRAVARGLSEYAIYVGSGYSTGDPREGTRFYTLDPFSGDVAASANVGDGLQTAFQNALVADPVTFSPERLVAGVDLPHPSSPETKWVYIGDIHGRLWKFAPTAASTPILFRDLGISQPIGVAAALLNLNAPYVFVETGADARVTPPPSGFRMFGFKDDGVIRQATTLPVPTPDFGQSFPAPPPAGKGDWRGTLQPVTAFRGTTAGGEGVVFFTGTRFNPLQDCVSSFDTLVFGLVGKTGGTAYDTTTYAGSKAVGLPRPPVPPATAGAPVPFDEGTPRGGEPETAPTKPGKVGTPAVVRATALRPGSSVCR